MDSAQLTAALRRFFGFDDFLDGQREVVEFVLSGRDCCVIMPTGAGKSLCYQLPLLLKDGYGIVVSPLIALMKDQVDALHGRNIAAGLINSTVPFAEQCAVLDAVADGSIKLLYVAPERFDADFFRRFLERRPPSTLIVDEAHCISQWGHDFRPAYTRLGGVAERYGIAQVCAFTATATPRVRDDIRQQLNRPAMHVHVAGFKRPNLAFKVIECRGSGAKERILEQLLRKNAGATILYAATRKQVDELTAQFHCLGYHAGLSDAERARVQEEFMNAPAPVLAATNAFGMGIDRPDVRRVIHCSLTGSLEAYYQEAGRAGRDGEPAECILLFSYADRHVQEFLVEMNNPEPELLKKLYRELYRRSERGGHAPFEVSPRELSLLLDAQNDAQIYTALRILDHYGVLERTARNADLAGLLQLRGDPVRLKLEHAAEKNQRSRFLHRFAMEYGNREVRSSYSELATLTGLNAEQLRRVIRYLASDESGVLRWEPPAGGMVHLTDPETRELAIDFAELDRKRALELGRLDDVIAYARSRKCRQAELIGYFGEKTDSWQCGSCDNCDREASLSALPKRPLTQTEMAAARTMLACVRRFDGRFGRGKISLVLTGARRTEVLNLHLEHTPWFGRLRAMKQTEVMEFLKVLEEEGLLGHTEGDYPCLMLTEAGENFLEDGEEAPVLSLALPEAPARAPHRALSAKRTSDAAPRPKLREDWAQDRRLLERRELLDALRDYRMKRAKQLHQLPFQIFGDETLRQLVLTMPMTLEECASIKGVGPAKLRRYMPAVLKLIQEYRENS